MINKELQNKLDGKTIFDATKFVEWKKSLKLYNFQKLPKTAILVPNTHLISRFNRLKNKQIKGLNGNAYKMTENILLIANFGIGAPSIITLMEELKALGTESFIFFGYAGIINTNIEENELRIISKAHSLNGASFLYSPKKEYSNNTDYHKKIMALLNLKMTDCFSIDNPFKETIEIVDHFKKKGAELVDMETAAIFAFGHLYKINVASVLMATDNISSNQWFPPSKLSLAQNKLDKTISQLINRLSND